MCVCVRAHTHAHTPTCLLFPLILIKCQKAPFYNFQFRRKPSAENTHDLGGLRISREPTKHRSRFNAPNTKENSPSTENLTKQTLEQNRTQLPGQGLSVATAERVGSQAKNNSSMRAGNTGPRSSEAPPLEGKSEQTGREAALHGHTGAGKADGGTNTRGNQWSTVCFWRATPHTAETARH